MCALICPSLPVCKEHVDIGQIPQSNISFKALNNSHKSSSILSAPHKSSDMPVVVVLSTPTKRNEKTQTKGKGLYKKCDFPNP